MPGDWERLGIYVRRERKRRGLTQRDFAATIGISVRSLGSLERGESDRYDVDTLTVLEDALSWEPGSVETVLAGSAPQTNGSDFELAEIHRAWPHLSADERIMLARVAREAASKRH